MRFARATDMKAFLDEAYHRFARPSFIADDPIQVPRAFGTREDAEVIGFLTATLAWGQRKTIIANAWKLVRLMDESPYAFIMNADATDLRHVGSFVHRTFNGTDLKHFIIGLRHLYQNHGGMEDAFLVKVPQASGLGLWQAPKGITSFRRRFFEPKHASRAEKHVADPAKGSNAKRINMYLRWMVRPNDRGVDLGLWKRISPADLMVPLDVHSGRVARELGLLTRTQDDWKAVEELTAALRAFDPGDPVKYDIALFGLGVGSVARKA